MRNKGQDGEGRLTPEVILCTQLRDHQGLEDGRVFVLRFHRVREGLCSVCLSVYHRVQTYT